MAPRPPRWLRAWANPNISHVLVQPDHNYLMCSKKLTCSQLVHHTGQTEQEAQLSQRDRATLHVTEYFAKSLNVTQDYSK